MIMNENELITQVDENDNPIGLLPRKNYLNGQLIHRSSYLFLINTNQKILLQRRSLSKQWYAGKLTFPVVGTVANETYKQCMKREIKEAFGRSIHFKELFKYHHFNDIDKAFKVVYLAKAEKNEIVINSKYAENYLWLTLNQLKRDIKENPEKYADPFIVAMRIMFSKNLLAK